MSSKLVDSQLRQRAHMTQATGRLSRMLHGCCGWLMLFVIVMVIVIVIVVVMVIVVVVDVVVVVALQ